VNRRNVLKELGLGITAGMLLPGWLGACSEDNPPPKTTYDGRIAIVGAGAAGLYIADILKAKGLKVVVLEASDRVGGRVRTLKTTDKPTPSLLFNSLSEMGSDFPNELGAGLVKGSDSAWGKFIQELKLSTVNVTNSAADNYVVSGAYVDGASLATNPDFIEAKNFLDTLASQSGTGSVQDAVLSAGINANMHAILNAWIGNASLTSNDRMGMKGISEAAGLWTRNKEMLMLTDNPMQDALLSRFSKVIVDVQMNAAVKQIDYSGATVVVSGENPTNAEPFSLEVEKVIVTVPVSILKKGMINFTPGLPAEKVAALNSMEMEACLRVLLDFKANFWGDNSGFLYGAGQAPEYFNSGVGRSELSKTLSATISGAKASELSLLGKNVIGVLIAELDAIFSGKASTHIRTDVHDSAIAVIQDWSTEPYILGGASYSKPGGTNQHRIDLGAPLNDKLFFAGEATDSNGEFGTINGALLSAERAAREVAEAIGV